MLQLEQPLSLPPAGLPARPPAAQAESGRGYVGTAADT